MPDVDYYAVLGIERDATSDEVKAAYRRAVKAAHPDHGGTEGLFVLVQEAGEHLLDSSARAAYDSGTAITLREDRTPVADPWGEEWSDAPVHSPSQPPSFAAPWWAEPVERPHAKPRSRSRSLFDHAIRHHDAPPPVGVLLARLAFFAFVIGFIGLRVFTATPRDAGTVDRLGLLWTITPLLGAVAAGWAIRSIRNEPLRFGGARAAWTWLAIDVAATLVVIVLGTTVLRTAA